MSPLAGCQPIRPPRHGAERIHSYFRELVNMEAQLQRDPLGHAVPRRVVVPMFVGGADAEIVASALGSGFYAASTLYEVPTTHRLGIQQVHTYVSVDKANPWGSTTNMVRGYVISESMRVVMKLTNLTRGSGAGQKIFEGTRPLAPVGILTALSLPKAGPEDFAYIALPGEELQLEVRALPTSDPTTYATQFGLILDGLLIPTEEWA